MSRVERAEAMEQASAKAVTKKSGGTKSRESRQRGKDNWCRQGGTAVITCIVKEGSGVKATRGVTGK